MLSVAISSKFESGVQQDAQEFYSDLLEKLDESCVAPRSSQEPSSTEEGGIAKEIFGGRLKSQVKTCELSFATWNSMTPYCYLFPFFAFYSAAMPRVQPLLRQI